MNRSKILIKNQIVITLFGLFGQILVFITFPMLIKHVGNDDFGIYSLSGALGSYITIFITSFRAAFIKNISELDGKNDIDSINIIFNTSIITYFIFGFILALYNLFLAYFGIHFFSIPETSIWKAETIFALNAIFCIFMMPLSLASSYFNAVQKNVITSIFQILLNILFSIAIIYTIYKKENIIFLFILNMSGHLLLSMLSFSLLFKKYHFLSIKKTYFSTVHFKQMMNYSSWMFLIALAFVLIYQTDQIIIGLFLPVGMITFYQIGAKLHNIIKMIDGFFGTPITPSLSNAIGAKDLRYIEQLKYRGLKFLLFIFAPIITMFIIFAGPIISLWIGPEYAKDSTLLTQLFVGYWYFGIIVFFMGRLAQGYGYVKEFALVIFFGAFLNVILSIAFIKTIGIIGVVLGTLVQFILIFPLFFKTLTEKLELSLQKLLIEIIVPIYSINLVLGLFIYSINKLITINSISILVLVTFSSTLITYFFEFLILKSEEKQFISNSIKSALGKITPALYHA